MSNLDVFSINNSRIYYSVGQALESSALPLVIEEAVRKDRQFQHNSFFYLFDTLEQANKFADLTMPKGKQITEKMQTLRYKILVLDTTKTPVVCLNLPSLPDSKEDDGLIVTYMQLENEPSNYILLRAWLGNEPYSVCEAVPQTYRNFFLPIQQAKQKKSGSDHNKAFIDCLIALFEDYYRPRFGLFLSGHWNRHHSVFAKEVVNYLKTLEQSVAGEDAKLFIVLYTKLFEARESLLNSFPELNLNGSFIRRLTYALEQIFKNLEEPIEQSNSHYLKVTHISNRPKPGL